jgi:hypothetical protein
LANDFITKPTIVFFAAGATGAAGVTAGAQAASTKLKITAIARIRVTSFILSSRVVSFALELPYGAEKSYTASTWRAGFLSSLARE